MRRNRRYILPYAIFLTLALLIAWTSSSRIPSLSSPLPTPLPMDDWDVSQLVSYLHRAGVKVHAIPCQKDATLDSCAFLTVTEKQWRDVNGLSKSPSLIHEWQGIVYCARETPDAATYLAHQWGERSIRFGPFICYGDGELLTRIGAAIHTAPATMS